MSEKSKGTLCGIVAAVSYGMNPLGALSLYRAGINTNSVLFYRYALAARTAGSPVVGAENFAAHYAPGSSPCWDCWE